MGWILVIFGNTPLMKTLIAVALITTVSLIAGYLGSVVFNNCKIHTVEELRNAVEEKQAS